MYYIEGVLFDFDITLVDLHFDWESLKSKTRYIFRKYEIKTDNLSMKELLNEIDTNLFGYLPKFLRELKKELYPVLLKIELEHVKKATLMPGVRTTLEQLRKIGVPFGIVSNNFHMTIIQVIKRLLSGFEDIIIVGREDTSRVKPDPEPLQKALEFLKIKSNTSLYVGDSAIDMRAGKAAGAITVGIANKYSTVDDLRSSGADIVFNNINEILKYSAFDRLSNKS